MKSESEIKERVEYWKGIRAGIIKGEETRKTIRHLLEELEWVLGEEDGKR